MPPVRPAPRRLAWFAALALVFAAGLPGAPLLADPDGEDETPEQRLAAYFAAFEADRQPAENRTPEHFTPCEGGQAAGFPCDHVDLLEYMPLSTVGGAGANANDLWGWTDPLSGKEYALLGLTIGTAFVDISDPEEPIYLGILPSHTGTSIWRDIKTYSNHAYIVSDSNGNHGMQVFDLTQLRNVPAPPVTFTETAHYGNIGSVHNLAIDEATGYAYLVGGSSGTQTCGGGLHMVSLANPESPAFAGCYSAAGYTHDTECVVYSGPDTAHVGAEICLNSNGPAKRVVIVDVTDKSAPVQLSTTPYSGSAYPHQAWLTPDQRYLLLDDELDEQTFGHNTHTYVWDVSDLDAPVLRGFFTSPVSAIDHNQYVVGNYSFQANYRSGLRILRIDDPATASLTQVGYFDVYPANDDAEFNGSWSVYPFFSSGVVILSGIEQGLFILRPVLCTTPPAPTGLDAVANGDQRIDTSWSGSGTPGNTFRVERALGGCAGIFSTVAQDLASPAFADTSASGGAPYGYRVRELDPTGRCVSAPSSCDTATTTGACTTGPAFAGLASASNPATSTCGVGLSWSAATAYCGGPVSYSVYRGTSPDFVPDAAHRIASGLAGTSFLDAGVDAFATYDYIVRATDGGNAAEEGNLVVRGALPTGPLADGTFATGAEIGDPPLDSASNRAVEHVGWHISTARHHGGARSFWSTSLDNLCVSLVVPPLTLTAGQTPQLTFWTAWDLENRFDGGVVEVSTDGSNWSLLTPNGGYPNTFNTGSDACGYALNTGCFTGLNQLTFQQKTVSLAAQSGQTVLLRFNVSTDPGTLGEGWFVDDIAITHAQVPGTCAGTTMFADGFESGTVAAWSSHTP